MRTLAHASCGTALISENITRVAVVSSRRNALSFSIGCALSSISEVLADLRSVKSGFHPNGVDSVKAVLTTALGSLVLLSGNS